MKRLVVLAIAAVFVVGLSGIALAQDLGANEKAFNQEMGTLIPKDKIVNAQQFHKVWEEVLAGKRNAYLIDLRTDSEFEAFHIEGTDHVQAGHWYVLPKKIKDPDAESIGAKWRKLTTKNQDTTAQLVLLKPLFRQVGVMHVKGLGQKDIHLDNFLCHHGHLKIIDGDGVFSCRFRSQKTANLGLLMAQLPPLAAKTIALPLLGAYQEGGGSRSITLGQLQTAESKQRHKCLRIYLQKTLRNCTRFKAKKLLPDFSAWSAPKKPGSPDS